MRSPGVGRLAAIQDMWEGPERPLNAQPTADFSCYAAATVGGLLLSWPNPPTSCGWGFFPEGDVELDLGPESSHSPGDASALCRRAALGALRSLDAGSPRTLSGHDPPLAVLPQS